jgi:hypothetical protein
MPSQSSARLLGVFWGYAKDVLRVSSADRITLPTGQGGGEELQAFRCSRASYVRDDYGLSLVVLEVPNRWQGKAARAGQLSGGRPSPGAGAPGHGGAAFEGRDRSSVDRKQTAAVRNAEHATTFEAVAREWHAQQVSSWVAVHASDVLNSLEKDVFPYKRAHH